MTSLQELLAQRIALQEELEQLEKAIAAFGDSTPVAIWTRRNLRNSLGPEELVVFADKALKQLADPADHGGWVVRSDWEQYKLDNPEMIGDFIGEN